jgi:HEPN domain-containing protein
MKNVPNDPRTWLAYATDDLLLARRALDLAPAIPHGACFHAQQAAEKSLKAFLIAGRENVSRTHNLNLLVTLCRALDPAFADLADPCELLNGFGTTVRYPPTGFDEPTEAQARQAVAAAAGVVAFVQARLATT